MTARRSWKSMQLKPKIITSHSKVNQSSMLHYYVVDDDDDDVILVMMMETIWRRGVCPRTARHSPCRVFYFFFKIFFLFCLDSFVSEWTGCILFLLLYYLRVKDELPVRSSSLYGERFQRVLFFHGRTGAWLIDASDRFPDDLTFLKSSLLLILFPLGSIWFILTGFQLRGFEPSHGGGFLKKNVPPTSFFLWT